MCDAVLIASFVVPRTALGVLSRFAVAAVATTLLIGEHAIPNHGQSCPSRCQNLILLLIFSCMRQEM